MGSCISKCSPKSHFQVEQDDQFCNQVQDKLVISTQPPKPITPISSHHSNKISPFPSSPSHSTSSASSFSYCTSTTTSTNTTNNSNSTLSSSSSTLSSSASSVSSSSKIDRTFSNEFLWSCYKENPHISRIASIKEAQKPVSAATLRKHDDHHQQSQINRGNGSPKTTPQKRVRTSNSPALKRQKSFRKEPEKPVIPTYARSLRSPSPSRRFTVSDKNRGTVMANPPKPVSNIRPASPNNHPSRVMARPCLKSPARETQTRIHRISSKIDEVAVREALAHDQYMESVPEDIDNPLIALDCFIFL